MSDHITDREYFALPAAWAILAESAEKHDIKAFHEAAGMLCMEPANIMRGMGYLNYMLAQIPDDDYSRKYIYPALSAISGVMALCAVLVEHQSNSDCCKLADRLTKQGSKGPR